MGEMSLAYIAALVAAGFFAGVVNVIAGGGSVFTIQTLLWFGVPSEVSNGTNRLAVLAQAIFGLQGMKSGEQENTRPVPMTIFAVACVLGALVGGMMPAEPMRWILKGTLVAMSLLALSQATAKGPSENLAQPTRSENMTRLLFFGLGFYGGLLQIGIGIVLVALLVKAFGWTTGEATRVKLQVTLVVGIFSVAIYSGLGRVQWAPAVCLGCGSAIGAFLAGKWTSGLNEARLRRAFGWLSLCMTLVVVVLR